MSFFFSRFLAAALLHFHGPAEGVLHLAGLNAGDGIVQLLAHRADAAAANLHDGVLIPKGALEECWGSGTAAVISPVGALRYEDTVMEIGGGGIGPVSQKLYDTVTGLQTGKVEDTFGWTVEVDG